MSRQDKNIKQIYDQCSAMITNLHIKKRAISQEEMYSLLSLLDMAILKKQSHDIIDLLRSWQNGPRDEEIDAIIKATLLQIDYKDEQSIRKNQAIIADLINCQTDPTFN